MESLVEALYQLCLDQNCPKDIKCNQEHVVIYALHEKRIRNEDIGNDPTYLKMVNSKEAVRRAEENWTKTLKWHSIAQQPKRYVCTICHNGAGVPLNSVKAVLKHVMEKPHIAAESVEELNRTSVMLPEPSEPHCEAVTNLLKSVLEKVAMTDDDVIARQNFVQDLNNKLVDCKCGIKLVLMGSSATGLGFKTSDLNIYASQEVTHEKRDTELDDWALLGKVLNQDDRLGELTAVLAEKSFSANLNLEVGGVKTDVVLRLCTNSNTAFQHIQLNTLFQNYCVMCPWWMRSLTMALRILMQMLKLDDPDRNGMAPEVIIILVIYYLQREAGMPVLKIDGSSNFWKLEDRDSETSLGYHWMKMLKFYSRPDVFEKGIGILATTPDLSHGSFTGVRIPIQSPMQPHLNIHRIGNNMAGNFITALRRLCRYFGIPRSIYGPVYDFITEEVGRCFPIKLRKVVCAADESTDAFMKQIHTKEGMIAEDVKSEETVILKMYERAPKEWEIERGCAWIADDLFPVECYSYVWSTGAFGIKKQDFPEFKCRTCQKGHAVRHCQVDVWVRPRNAGSLEDDSLRALSNKLEEYRREQGLDEFGIIKRKRVISELESCIQTQIRAARLHEFGSGVNGFGNKFCDIDLCMTVNENDDIETLEYDFLSPDFVQYHLERVRRALAAARKDYTDIVFIKGARVPIVKFHHKATECEGDISMSNYLAYHNSQLLRTYSHIDPRVSTLGIFLKYVMKICGLSEVCTGGLSSYAHVLMLIHYLQQDVCEPAVLPVLQQLPTKMLPSKVQGWIVKYFGNVDQLAELRNHWTGYGGNRDSVGKLFMGFLRYYTEVFDYEKHVITIRQKEPLTRIEKFWSNPSLISIEDPFMLTHDLGRAFKRHVSLLMVNTFGSLRQRIYEMAKCGELEQHFFESIIELSKDVIKKKGNATALPKCKRCNEFGHLVKNCPRNTQRHSHRQPLLKRERLPSHDSHTSDDSPVASKSFPAKPAFRRPPSKKKMFETRVIENSVYKKPVAENSVYKQPAEGK